MHILIASLIVQAPASADARVHAPHRVSAALRAGCAVQQIHQPAGKIGVAPAIVRCRR